MSGMCRECAYCFSVPYRTWDGEFVPNSDLWCERYSCTLDPDGGCDGFFQRSGDGLWVDGRVQGLMSEASDMVLHVVDDSVVDWSVKKGVLIDVYWLLRRAVDLTSMVGVCRGYARGQ